MTESISGYTNDDVNLVLQRVYENAVKDRNEAKEIYDIVKQKISEGSPDMIFMIGEANRLLETVNKQNEVLVRLAGVIQRLQTNVIVKRKSNLLNVSDFNELLETMDRRDDDIKVAKFLEEASVSGVK